MAWSETIVNRETPPRRARPSASAHERGRALGDQKAKRGRGGKGPINPWSSTPSESQTVQAALDEAYAW